MRALADSDRIEHFMRELGPLAREEGRIYFTGGATAVLNGWRDSTIDVDIKLVPEQEQLLRELPRIKEDLQLNVELAAPSDFIPVPKGWEDRSPFVRRHGRLSFHHFDLVSQALAKAERGHAQDRQDVEQMLARGLVHAADLRAQFELIEPQLYRFPGIDPASFRASLDDLLSR